MYGWQIATAMQVEVSTLSQKRKYSDYYKQLEVDAKKRYNEKLDSLGRQMDDPYTFNPRPGITEAAMSDIQYPDI